MFHYFRDTAESARKNIVRNALAGMAVFCVISGLWVATISIKYNYFTLGTVGDYVVRLVGPDNRAVPEFYGPERDDPVYWAGLLKPAYATALSAWDDPSFVSRKLMMDKATLWSDPAYLIKYMLKNVSKILQIVFTKFFSFLSIPVLIAYVLLCLQPLNKLIRRCDILYPFATLLLYSSGLTLFIVHLHNVRYFWLDNVLLLLMAGQVLTLLFRNEFFSSSLRKNVLTVLVALSFIILPAGPILEQKSTRGKRLYALSAELKKTYSMQGNIASDDKWGDTLQVVYDLRNNFNSTVSFYGMPKKNQSSEEILNELRTNAVD
ncbi:MAG: hypothetical protein HZC11_00145, partial [Nitrospirae bacterium]|nr:hypothetical protein [Nitrospirota bacterium]